MRTINTIDLSELDLRYEAYRLKQPKQEERLLLSILKRGIRDPLRGVRVGETNCLLDGFKRMRCARQLAITTVPYQSLGDDEALGIIDLMRESFSKGLNVIEQINLIHALESTHGWSRRDIAESLGKSPAWVSLRVAMNRELTPKTTEHILSGRLQARSYLYTILPLTRVNKIKPEQIERFVEGVAGHHLTTRQIDRLARAYFTGRTAIREQIENGRLQWALECLKSESNPPVTGCTPPQQSLLQGLEMVRSGMLKIKRFHKDPNLQSGAFLAQVNLLTQTVLEEMKPFLETIRSLHDRSR